MKIDLDTGIAVITLAQYDHYQQLLKAESEEIKKLNAEIEEIKSKAPMILFKKENYLWYYMRDSEEILSVSETLENVMKLVDDKNKQILTLAEKLEKLEKRSLWQRILNK